LKRLHVYDVVHDAAALLVVIVEYGDEVVELLGAGIHSGFPDYTLLGLAVSKQAVDLAALLAEVHGGGNAESKGHAVAERASSSVNTGDFLHVWVPLKHGSDLLYFPQLIDGEEAAVSQSR